MNGFRVEFPPALMPKELAAYYIGRSPRELDRLRDRHEITAYGDGRNAFFKKSELDEYIARMPERTS